MAIDLDPRNELQWIKEGRVFSLEHGDLTTPAAFETDLVRQTWDWGVRVPAGTVIVPLRLQVITEATGAAVFQCLLFGCANDPGVTGKTAKDPVNANSRYATVRSKCYGYITSTNTSGTAPSGVMDVHRVYVQPDIDAITGSATFEQVLYDPLRGKGLPCIVGDDSNVTFFGALVGNGTSATGYVLGSWVEFTYDEFYAA